MKKLSEFTKNYFICDGNSNTVYEIVSVETESVSIKAVLNDAIEHVNDSYIMTSRNFNGLEIKKLSYATINKIKRGEIKINDLYKKYFVN